MLDNLYSLELARLNRLEGSALAKAFTEILPTILRKEYGIKRWQIAYVGAVPQTQHKTSSRACLWNGQCYELMATNRHGQREYGILENGRLFKPLTGPAIMLAWYGFVLLGEKAKLTQMKLRGIVRRGDNNEAGRE